MPNYRAINPVGQGVDCCRFRQEFPRAHVTYPVKGTVCLFNTWLTLIGVHFCRTSTSNASVRFWKLLPWWNNVWKEEGGSEGPCRGSPWSQPLLTEGRTLGVFTCTRLEDNFICSFLHLKCVSSKQFFWDISVWTDVVERSFYRPRFLFSIL